MELQHRLKRNAQSLEQETDLILKKWRDEINYISPSLLPLVDQFIKSNKGGKKLRGFLVRLGYELQISNVKSPVKDEARQRRQMSNGQDILKIAAAYEIFHTSILAHDDIIDQSIERRGSPSLYQALGGNHYGISQAICLADAGFFLATRIISEADFPDKEKNMALALFSKTMVDTALGQMLDVNLGERGKGKGERNENTIQLINLLKTARYTIAGPLQLGAILAGLGPTSPRLRGIKEFGENLGIAFQIRDDILDGEVESVEQAQVEVLKYADQARSIIPKLTDNIRTRRLLSEIVDYMVERNK